MNQPRRVWMSRLFTLLVIWTVLYAVAWWLRMGPNPLAIGAVATAVGAICWFVSDSTELLYTPGFADPTQTRRRPVAHGRLALLRRLSEDAARRSKSGRTPPGAVSFQHVLRELAERKIAARIGHPPSPAELADLTDPRLTAYLSDPNPPVLNPTRQNELIDRIEAL